MFRSLRFPIVALILLCVVPDPSSGASRRQRTARTVQATVSDQGLAILASPGFAKVVSGASGPARIRVRRNEELTAVEETSGGLIAAGVRRKDGERQLVFLGADTGGTERLPSPARSEALQLRPILLMESGNMVGAAWLEGPDLQHLRVKTADWDGMRWSPALTVSSPSPGSQTGLTGTILRNGSTLLVWSQFDGADDELFYTWRGSGDFTPPQRVSADNSHPDVAPSVTFNGRGAIVAWSRFDGVSYSVWTAEFSRSQWRHERLLGEPGSLFPQFLHREDSLYLVTRSSLPRGWSIHRTSTNRRHARRSFVPSNGSARPVLTATSGESITVAFPQEHRRARARLELVP